MPKITVTVKHEVEVKYLSAMCKPRYWEDVEVSGIIDGEDVTYETIPCRDRWEGWAPIIDLDTGIIQNWVPGVTAKIHYKVCDAGVYALLDQDRNAVTVIEGYVPKIMCPGGDGYGDYIIMNIDENGLIKNWKLDLKAFEKDD
jgi:hypothetical protein